MRYIGLVLSSAVLTGCSAAGIGSPQTSNCAPYCMPYIASGNAVPTYTQPTYVQPYGQPSPQSYWTHAPVQMPQSPQAYGTHAQHVQVPQLKGLSDPYSARGYKYGNLGAILYDFDSKKFGVQGRLGYQSAGLFGAELEGSISLGAETEDLSADATAAVMGISGATAAPSASTLTTEYTNSIAAFGLARLPVSNRLMFHSRAGLHSTRFKAELDDGVQVLSQNESSIGIAYGVGAEYALTPSNNIRFDYTVYDTDAGGNADSLSLAVTHKF